MSRSTIASWHGTLVSFLQRSGWVVVLILLAVALRWPLLSGSLWLDEAAQALESIRPLNQQLEIVPDFQPPLLHIWLHMVQMISMSEVWMRLGGALVPGVFSIVFTILLARNVMGKRSAIVVGLLMATSSFHIFFSQELRQYALPTLWVSLSWWLLIRDRYSLRMWIVFTLVSSLGWYSSYLYPFAWGAQVLWLLLSKPAERIKTVVSSVATVVAFIPILPLFARQLGAGGMVRTSLPGWEKVVSFDQLKSIPLVFGKFVFGVVHLDLNTPWLLVSGVLAVSVVLSVISMVRRWWQTDGWSEVATRLRQWSWLLVWLVVPLTVAWLVSFKIPVIQPKRVLWILPAFYLAVVWMVRQTKPIWLGRFVVGLLMLLNILGVAQYWMQPSLQREDWRAAHAWVMSRYPSDQTLIAFAFDEPFAPWRWYDNGQYQTWSFGKGALAVNQVNDLRVSLESVRRFRYVVTFDYLTDLSDPTHRLHQELEAYGFKEVDMVAYPNMGFVRVWARQNAVLSSNNYARWH